MAPPEWGLAMQRIGRREVLMGAGAGTIGLAVVALPATAALAEDDGHSRRGLEGAWLITHMESGPEPSPAQAVVTLAAGGALVARDINPPGTAQLGAWRKTGGHNFAATFWDTASEGPDGPNLTVKIIVNGTWNGDQISGTFAVTIFDDTGAPVPGAVDGTFSGTRIIAGT